MNMNPVVEDLYRQGVTAARRLYQQARERGASVTQKQVSDWVKTQVVAQARAPAKPASKPTGSVVSTAPYDLLEIDLWDLSRKKDTEFDRVFTRGRLKYILIMVDVFSRYVWVEDLQSKTRAEVSRALDQFLKNKPFRRVYADAESAWNTPDFWSELNGPAYTRVEHPPHAEAIIGVLKRRMADRKLLGTNLGFRALLDDVVAKYNTETHQVTRVKPAQALKSKELDKTYRTAYEYSNRDKTMRAMGAVEDLRTVYSVGDSVRVDTRQGPFAKGTEARWSEPKRVTAVGKQFVTVDRKRYRGNKVKRA